MAIKTTGTPIRGNRVWYFVQGIDEPIGSEATLPAYQTDGGMTLGGEMIDEQTKQGRILEKESDEHSVELTQYFVAGDPSIKIVEDAQNSGDSVKVWRVVADKSAAEEGEPGSKTYPAHFGYGKVEDLETTEGEGFVEVSYTLNIVGALKRGRHALTDEDLAMIESVYEYQEPGETTGDFDNITTA